MEILVGIRLFRMAAPQSLRKAGLAAQVIQHLLQLRLYLEEQDSWLQTETSMAKELQELAATETLAEQQFRGLVEADPLEMVDLDKQQTLVMVPQEWAMALAVAEE
jgi:hypothetical protein